MLTDTTYILIFENKQMCHVLFKELKEKKEERNFKCVWSRMGTVFIRPICIHTILDPNKLNEY